MRGKRTRTDSSGNDIPQAGGPFREVALTGKQITVSEGHQWPPRKGSTNDVGGPFYTTRSYVKGNPHRRVTLKRILSGITRRYDGPVWAYQPEGGSGILWPSSAESSDSVLKSMGTTAIARCAPTNSVADAATFLGETLKDGIPSVPLLRALESRTRVALRAGDEFLNTVFGWLPLVSDVTNLRDAVVHAETVLKQFERDSGRTVRRTYNFPLDKSATDDSVIATNTSLRRAAADSDFESSLVPPDGYGTVVKRSETVRRQWFSGAFTYHLPSDFDSRKGMVDSAANADKLFGVSLTPEVLWELTPWSWAVDWVTNAGDVLHNLSQWQQFGLVLRYGYMMEHSIKKDTYTFFGKSGLFGRPDLSAPPLVLITETKKRVPAGPFGFGLTWDGLSPLQISILSAVGITRGA